MFYVPGHARWKMLTCVCGLVLLGIGLAGLWPPLRSVVRGRHVQAVAKRIVLTRPGEPDLVFTGDDEVRQAVAARDTRDTRGTFWNVFEFQTGDGRTVERRDSVGSRGGPLYPLIDADGLPTTILVCYDARDPQRAAFPTEVTTWLAPAVLALSGLVCAAIGAILFHWAGRPVELPDISTDGI